MLWLTHYIIFTQTTQLAAAPSPAVPVDSIVFVGSFRLILYTNSLTPAPDEDGSPASFIPEQFFLLIKYKNLGLAISFYILLARKTAQEWYLSFRKYVSELSSAMYTDSNNN
jgi:hypothetical protein